MAYRMITSFVFTLIVLGTICDAQLSSTFYDSTCPNALSTIRTSIRTAVSKECRMAASVIRLHFHDCFVQVITIFIFINPIIYTYNCTLVNLLTKSYLIGRDVMHQFCWMTVLQSRAKRMHFLILTQ